MSLNKIIASLLCVVIALALSDVQTKAQEASIIIDATPIGAETEGVFNVSIIVRPLATYDSPLGETRSGFVPIRVSLPWYVDVSNTQCFGDCNRLPKVGTDNTISSGVRDGTDTTATIAFTMKVRDDSYSAVGIVVRAGASFKDLYVPIKQPANRQVNTMGEVRVVSLLLISDPDEEYVIDIDISLPLSGGAVVVVPPGLSVGAESGCVDARTREPSDFGQMCMARILPQTNGDTWVQVLLPGGDFSMRIYLTPGRAFEHGTVEMSAGGRYFETEIAKVSVPEDFQATPQS